MDIIPTLTDVDGYPVPAGARITRDTFDVGPGQRIDLALATGGDGYHASGPGVWMLHDHSPDAAVEQGHRSRRQPHRDRL